MTVLQHLRAAASLALTELAARLLTAAERVEGAGEAESLGAPELEDDDAALPGPSVSISPASQQLVDAYLDRPPRRREPKEPPPPLAGSLADRARGGDK